ncbi:TPA: 30S ribosomal protein S3, partial [Candidatus Peribacteria bacterium]|nr:30S ribosomal protein S3 [Candidatus Peribacteria bacterium]
MGQKVNPNGIRLGMTHSWPSTWFASGKKYRDLFVQDMKIRRYITEKFQDAGVSGVDIDRSKKISLTIHTSKPGVIIGKQGVAIETLRKELEKKFGGSFEVNIQEIR